MSEDNKPSEYLQYLPVIYQENRLDSGAGFLGRFLKAFEKMLSGRPEDSALDMGEVELPVGIEQIANHFQDYFNPYLTPPQFLPWLASWVALTLKEGRDWYGDRDYTDMNAETQSSQLVPLNTERQTKNRALIHQIVQLYQKRGTREGLIAYLKIYLGEQTHITINEFAEPFCVGVSSTVGVGTVVGEGRPHYFEINMVLPIPSRELLDQKRQVLIEIINQEKPAHTYYNLIITVPTMQIGVHSKIGSDTLLGGMITS